MISFRPLEKPRGRGKHNIGAYEDEKLVGYIVWDEPEDRQADHPYVHALWVELEYRGKGLGKELCLRAITSRNRDVGVITQTAEWDAVSPVTSALAESMRKEHAG